MTPKHLVGDALDVLAKYLDGVIQARLSGILGGLEWTALVGQLDDIKGLPPRSYSRTDLQTQLRVLTERLGKLHFPFDDQQRTVSTLGSELRIVRNDFSHGGSFTWTDAWRAGDFAVRLLEHLGDVAGAHASQAVRDQAFEGMAAELGIDLLGAKAKSTSEVVSESDADVAVVESPDDAEPPAEVFERPEPTGTVAALGSDRMPFAPWKGVIVGPKSVIDDLPQKAAKMRVRAVATEIAEFEGPVEIERLARLTVAAFGWERLAVKRLHKIAYQIKQVEGLAVDDFGYVWPQGLDATTWSEFRPQSGSSPRAFTQISPHEIANAAAFVEAKRGREVEDVFRHDVIAVFGRSKMTAATRAHLDVALGILAKRRSAPGSAGPFPK